MHAGALTQYLNLRPAPHLPKTSRLKALLLRCSQLAWAKAAVTNCHHRGAQWLSGSAAVMPGCSRPAPKTRKLRARMEKTPGPMPPPPPLPPLLGGAGRSRALLVSASHWESPPSPWLAAAVVRGPRKRPSRSARLLRGLDASGCGCRCCAAQRPLGVARGGLRTGSTACCVLGPARPAAADDAAAKPGHVLAGIDMCDRSRKRGGSSRKLKL